MTSGRELSLLCYSQYCNVIVERGYSVHFATTFYLAVKGFS